MPYFYPTKKAVLLDKAVLIPSSIQRKMNLSFDSNNIASQAQVRELSSGLFIAASQ